MTMVQRVEGFFDPWRRRFRVMRLYAHDLASIPTVTLAPGDRIEPLDPNRRDILLDIHAIDLSEDSSRLSRGQKCFIGWSNGKAAHYCWVQDTGLHDIRGTWRREPIRPGEFWLYSGRTAEWARGRRLCPGTLVTILRQYKRDGFTRGFATVAEENRASISAIERAGFVLTERIRSLAFRSALLRLPGSSYPNDA